MSNPQSAAIEAIPAHGLSIVEGQPSLDTKSFKAALSTAPHLVEALAAAPAPKVEETYDNTPSYAPEGPAPRF